MQKTDFTKQPEAFQKKLLEWYRGAQRPLPWRLKPSLYRTVVSELMAQQTQIKTMLPYFERWMERFPDFAELADAPEADVLKHWEGLGYYSRARNLHKLAKAYQAADKEPVTRGEWMTMPGIGPYTSAAISSIVFGQADAVIDGNVVRILARLIGDTQVFKNNGDAVKAITPLAEAVLNKTQPGDHNQAMMELGATVCLKSKPLCTICPVAEFCKSRNSPALNEIPKIERRATEKITIERAWILHERKLLLHKIPEDSGQLAGQYELPKLKDLNISTPSEKPLATKQRAITHRRIREIIYKIPPPRDLPDTHFWIPVAKLESITLSGPHRRWIQELLS